MRPSDTPPPRPRPSLPRFRRSRRPDCRAIADCRAIRRDRRGAVAVLFALMMIPLIAMVGIGIDFAKATNAKTNLGLALDQATLMAVNLASNAILTNPSASLAAAQAAAVANFTAAAARIGGVELQPVTVTITRSGSSFTATASYTGTYIPIFGNILGLTAVPVSSSSTAVLSAGPYVDIHVLLDASNSMLIAGSQTDINNLLALDTVALNLAAPASLGWWQGGCAFACHWDPAGLDFYGLTRGNGITLRLDQLKVAIGTIATAVNAVNAKSLYRLGLWTFEQSLSQVDALTKDAPQVGTDAGKIGPGVWDPYEVGHDTNITQALTYFANNTLQQAGNGSTAAAPRKFVFLMTDGVEDVDDGNGYRIETPVQTSACDAIKAKGATIVVLHTLYYNPDGMFDEISAIQPQVTANLQACASGPELYFQVTDQASITAAVQAMLNYALAAPAHFTQ